MSYVLPSMGLLGISIGLDTGLTIETNTNSNWAAVDGHDHSPGKGVQVTPAGIDITTDLAFNGNNATLLRSSRYSPQTVALALPADLGCTYVAGVDLYYNDLNGNQIQLTAGGSVNATSSGISDGTATASFVSGVLVVDSDVATPANIQVGSVLLGNNVANSHFLTLSPPTAMAADFSLVLPALPAASSFVTLDASGNFGASIHTASGITGSNIAPGTITTTQIQGSTIKQSNMNILNPAKSSSTGTTTTSASFVQIGGLTSTLATTGGHVVGNFLSGYFGIQCLSPFTVNGSATFQVRRNGTPIAVYSWTPGLNTGLFQLPVGAWNFMDPAPAGTNVYTMWVACVGGQTQFEVPTGVGLWVYEI